MRGHLWLHASDAHEVSSSKQIEDLVVTAHLDIRLDDHGVIRLEYGVDKLVQGDGATLDITFVEVLALEDARDVESAHETEHLRKIEGLQPIAVVNDGRPRGIEHLHSLLDVRLGVCLDLLLSERWARAVATRGITDEGGAVAYDERDRMSQVLELAHLSQGHRMAKVQVRRGGVYSQLDVEGPSSCELPLELLLGHNLHGARRDDLQLLVYWQHISLRNLKFTSLDSCQFSQSHILCQHIQWIQTQHFIYT